MDFLELKKQLASAAADVKVRQNDGLPWQKQAKLLADLKAKAALNSDPKHVRSLSNSIGKLIKK
jgi:hypothetical protein